MFLCVTELEKDRITVLSLGEIRYGENEIILYLFPNGRTVLGRSVIYNNSPGFNFFQKWSILSSSNNINALLCCANQWILKTSIKRTKAFLTI